MSNQGEFASGGVTKVAQLPVPTASLRGSIYYLTAAAGGFDQGYYSISESEVEWTSMKGTPSPVYITGITALAGNNISNTVTSSDSYVLDSFRTDNQQIEVHVMALPHEDYKPTVEVETVAVTNMTREAGGPEWTGSVIITLPTTPLFPDTGTITAKSVSGSKHEVIYELKMPPDVLTVAFSGSYPGTQTEVKTGQTYEVDVTTNVPMTGVRVEVLAGSVRESTVQIIPVTSGTSATINVTIQNNHSNAVPELATIRVTAHDVDLSYGDSMTSSSTVQVNNITPTGSIIIGSYSNGFSALASGDTVSVTFSASNYDSGSETISSPSGELNVSSASIGFTSVAYLSGGYNVSADNVRLFLTRAANNTTAQVNEHVSIADTLQVITVTEPSRLLSSSAGNLSSITITSNQQLYQAPTLVAPTGTFTGAAFTGGPSIWSRSLNILDSDTNGTPTWGSLSSVNLAGKVATAITGNDTYTVGGFTSRQLTFPAFGNDVAIGTNVADTAKLVVTAIGGTTLTYVSNSTADAGGKTYTITSGNIIHLNDTDLVSSNGTGTWYLTIEETI